MPKSHPPYAANFKRRLVELVRAGRNPEELAEKFEPTAQSIRNCVRQADRDDGRRQSRRISRPAPLARPACEAIDATVLPDVRARDVLLRGVVSPWREKAASIRYPLDDLEPKASAAVGAGLRAQRGGERGAVHSLRVALPDPRHRDGTRGARDAHEARRAGVRAGEVPRRQHRATLGARLIPVLGAAFESAARIER